VSQVFLHSHWLLFFVFPTVRSMWAINSLQTPPLFIWLVDVSRFCPSVLILYHFDRLFTYYAYRSFDKVSTASKNSLNRKLRFHVGRLGHFLSRFFIENILFRLFAFEVIHSMILIFQKSTRITWGSGRDSTRHGHVYRISSMF
jgi:type II secretory pathway component PulF